MFIGTYDDIDSTEVMTDEDKNTHKVKLSYKNKIDINVDKRSKKYKLTTNVIH